MPSVVVSWNGQCRDQALQQSLCSKMSELFEVSSRLFNVFFHGRINKTYFDGRIYPGKVLLSSYLFSGQSIPPTLEKVGKVLYTTGGSGLYGLQFPLFDPRKFNSPLTLANNDNLSFIFLRSADPGLDGRMVQMLRPQRNEYKSPAAAYEYLLAAPEIDLRYYLERWMGELLGWVKHFYVPNLSYWAWIDNPGYAGYEQISPDDRHARDEIFFYLRDAFEGEAEAWKSYCLKHQRKSGADDSPGAWMEFVSERLDQLALEEKRQRNSGT